MLRTSDLVSPTATPLTWTVGLTVTSQEQKHYNISFQHFYFGLIFHYTGFSQGAELLLLQSYFTMRQRNLNFHFFMIIIVPQWVKWSFSTAESNGVYWSFKAVVVDGGLDNTIARSIKGGAAKHGNINY